MAGYTLVSSSRGLSLRSHGPFESTQKAILDNLDILSTKDVFEPSGKRVYVEDTDEGARLKDQIADLKKLLAAYADGSVKRGRRDARHASAIKTPGGCTPCSERETRRAAAV